jgi:3-hydroxyacyl-[acyl-carrier-protein] dehydratase
LQKVKIDPTPISLPLDNAAIQRILPHRYPFLFVDRIVELEEDARIVGVKTVTRNDRYLVEDPGTGLVLPHTVLTEAMAQVGAILILSKPENRQKLIYFMSIDKARFRRAARPGEAVEIEALVLRLRSRMGMLRGIARVDGKVLIDGIMTFALGAKHEPPSQPAS